MLPSTARTRLVLEPCLTSLGALVVGSSSLRFVARVFLDAFLELDKANDGAGNGFGGSARRIDSGRNLGRGS